MSGVKILAPHSSSETHTPGLLSGSKYFTWVTGVRTSFACALLMFANGAALNVELVPKYFLYLFQLLLKSPLPSKL
jgi:hypothetical protein